jgi:hypothetical protein
MTKWDNPAFVKEASNIVQIWSAGKEHNGASLTELVKQAAEKNALNPEQINRLAATTNIRAFDAEFKKLGQQGAPDRVVDFDIADAKSVIAGLYKKAYVEKTASTKDYTALPDEMSSLRPQVDPFGDDSKYQTKIAAENLDRYLGPETPLSSRWVDYQKTVETLRMKKAGAEIRWNDTYAHLQRETKRLDWKQDVFEKNALALHGGDILPELNALRKEQGLPPINASTEKLAALSDRLVGEDTPHVALLKKAADARKEYLTFTAATHTAESLLNDLSEALRGDR